MKDLRRPSASFVPMATDMDYSYAPVEVVDGKIYLLTNYGAPRYRLMVADLARPAVENWRELVPQARCRAGLGAADRWQALLELQQRRGRPSLHLHARRQEGAGRAAPLAGQRGLQRQQGRTTSASSASRPSPCRARSIATLPTAIPTRSSTPPRPSSTPKPTSPSKCSIPARTARSSPCSSPTGKDLSGTAPTPFSSTDTEVSASLCRLRSRLRA